MKLEKAIGKIQKSAKIRRKGAEAIAQTNRCAMGGTERGKRK